ncbi:MAG: hypothetical protein J4451_02205 [DPANN group archaeon]|nr:hypothetical protein [DPANN group archaeon]
MAKQLSSSSFQTAAIIAIALIGLSLVTSATGFGIGLGTGKNPTAESDTTGCYTSDSGSNIYVSGVCTDFDGSFKETCALPNSVEESRCDVSSCKTEIIDCPSGYTCQNGACV